MKKYVQIKKEKAPLILMSQQPNVGISGLIGQFVESDLPNLFFLEGAPTTEVNPANQGPGYMCLVRACNSTLLSSTIYQLLFTIVIQIAHCYQLPYVDYSLTLKTTRNLINFLYDLLHRVSNVEAKTKPLIMILDGLEALLEDPDLPIFLEWLPLYLPAHTNFIITYTYDGVREASVTSPTSPSSLPTANMANCPGLIRQLLRRKFKGNPLNTTESTNTFIEILPLTSVRGMKHEFDPLPLIEYYLNKADRSITPQQFAVCIILADVKNFLIIFQILIIVLSL